MVYFILIIDYLGLGLSYMRHGRKQKNKQQQKNYLDTLLKQHASYQNERETVILEAIWHFNTEKDHPIKSQGNATKSQANSLCKGSKRPFLFAEFCQGAHNIKNTCKKGIIQSLIVMIDLVQKSIHYIFCYSNKIIKQGITIIQQHFFSLPSPLFWFSMVLGTSTGMKLYKQIKVQEQISHQQAYCTQFQLVWLGHLALSCLAVGFQFSLKILASSFRPIIYYQEFLIIIIFILSSVSPWMMGSQQVRKQWQLLSGYYGISRSRKQLCFNPNIQWMLYESGYITDIFCPQFYRFYSRILSKGYKNIFQFAQPHLYKCYGFNDLTCNFPDTILEMPFILA